MVQLMTCAVMVPWLTCNNDGAVTDLRSNGAVADLRSNGAWIKDQEAVGLRRPQFEAY